MIPTQAPLTEATKDFIDLIALWSYEPDFYLSLRK